MTWEKMPIKAVCRGIYDGPHATPPVSDSGAVFLGIPNFKNGKLDLSEIRYISEKDYPVWTRRVTPQANDIVFSYEATLNLYAIIPEGFRGCLGRRMALIRVDESKVDYKFLYYYFFSAKWRSVIQQNTVLGATVDRIPLVKFPDFEIELPPMPVQKKIADILSAYDDLIENNQKQIKLLEEAAQRLYKEWFIDLRFPGHESTPIVNGLPEGWKQTTVATVTTVLRRGISPFYSEKGASTVINQKCIRKTIVDFDESKKQDKEYPTELNIQDSDTVICSTGAGTLGRVGQIFGNHDKTTIDSHVTLVRSSSAIGKQFLFWAIKSQQPFLQEMGKGSTNQLELSRDVIKSLPILLPNSDVIGKFESETQAIHNKMIVLNEQTLSLQLIRDQLLPRLMSGNMEV